ncbi:MAG TPA: 3-oxoacyl-[acyl-carrier-protein] synthase III C-terminal domain-containing protein, partial [Pirellulales bacterium]
VEATIHQLNTDHGITRDTAKLAFASLTIGSASVAAVLTHESLAPDACRLVGGDYANDTTQVHLCHSGRDEAVSGEMRPLMTTDSEALMHAGVALGASAYRRFLTSVGWAPGEVSKSICHQVGLGHRKLMLGALELSPANDFITLHELGNTGSAACPVTLARAAEAGFLQPGDRTALLGIGSGINTVMLGLEWQPCPVVGGNLTM